MMNDQASHTTRIAVIGAGNVGSSFAFAMLLSGLASEIVLIDANQEKAEGEAMDLNHAMPLTHSTRIWSGDYADCAGAALTVITAGAAQKPGESRLELAGRNAAIFGQIVPEVVRHNPGGILLVATNPVDVMTYTAWKLSKLPAQRVIGSGTVLDTARFRYLLSQQFHVDPRSVHAYAIGEHGDSEVLVWSLANIAGIHLPEFCEQYGLTCDQELKDRICVQVRDAAYQIIEKKGATYFAIGAGLLRIAESILRNQNTVLSTSILVQDYYGIEEVFFSLPAVINRHGVERVLKLTLNTEETQALLQSTSILKRTISQIT